ncbi:MerR family transcriptional regulator [Celeribacter litoreus]|uniref:MerR family transcriptional regulator n=1 Tax=Celeribacter litoreus TaxID=2876714 RepID=UPI001CCC424E|nr:MerR family DNA-binding transcriptional regulator [Celeribacter litoreus]MCA0042866.1 MerR family DNA-binding transcriptional regulator [Celeribacter litoreus]
MPDQRLTFKEMCAEFDVTPRTLRYYEYIELLAPEKEGRSRFYTPREVARMTLILRGRKYGFSLEEMRQWLLIYEEEGTKAQAEAFVKLADRQLVALEAQKVELEKAIAELQELREQTVRNIESGEAQPALRETS